jgi:hypothetical protein
VDLEFQLTGKYEENRSIKDISDTKKNRVQVVQLPVIWAKIM